MSIGLEVQARCAEIASRQHGLITHQQLLDLGLDRSAIYRRVRAGSLIRMLPRVFRLGGAPRTWYQRVMAVHLWAGETSAISGRAAGALHRLDGLGVPTVIDVIVPGGLKPPNPLIYVHRPKRWDTKDATKVAGIAVTTCTRTLIDIAATATEDELEIAMEDARRRRLITLASLEERLGALPPNQPGRGRVGRILDIHGDSRPTDSSLEVKVLRLLRREGYPTPIRQEVLEADGRFLGRVDLLYADRRLVIEVDGYVTHEGRSAFDRDRQRNNGVVAMSWAVLHVTSEMLRGARRQQFLEDLARTYNRPLPAP